MVTKKQTVMSVKEGKLNNLVSVMYVAEAIDQL